MKRLKRNAKRGQTAVEYALIVGVLAMLLIGAVKGILVPMFQDDGAAKSAIEESISRAAGGQSQ